jgi:hypothetical protein
MRQGREEGRKGEREGRETQSEAVSGRSRNNKEHAPLLPQADHVPYAPRAEHRLQLRRLLMRPRRRLHRRQLRPRLALGMCLASAGELERDEAARHHHAGAVAAVAAETS